MRINRRLVSLLYIISVTIAFTTRYADFSYKNNHVQLGIATIWITIAFAQMVLNKFCFKELHRNEYIWIIKIYLLPHIVIHFYTIVLMILGKVSWNYFSTNISVYIPTLFALSSLYLFKVDAFKYCFIAMGISWILSVSISLIIKGPLIFPHALIQAYINPYDNLGGLTINYLELHDLVLAIGYVLTFYLAIKRRYKKKDFIYFNIAFIIMILGIKRISILGIILAVMFYKMNQRFSYIKQYRICLLSGWIAFALCYGFIWILSNGSAFYEFASRMGVNLMGRNYYYSAIVGLTQFKPSFWGLGRNVVAKLLATDLSYLRVGGVHSDILKMFAENGFILFGIWLWYYLIYITKQYQKKFNYQAAVLYFTLNIYTFILYLTDNIEVYFICQVIQIVIPVTYIWNYNLNKKM